MDSGWTARTANNGREALDKMQAECPDAILLDLMMPEMDGFEFVLNMRKNPDWYAIPIIVITAKDLTQEDRDRLNGHVQNILQKGAYGREELHVEIHRQIELYTGYQTGNTS